MTVTTEQLLVRHLFDRVEEIEDIADTLDHDDDRRARLLRVASHAIADCGPIRSRIAAELLQLSEPTIRSWVREGLLAKAEGTSRVLTLDPSRLHEVMHLVDDLRRAGRTKGLLDAVWHRLSDTALLERDDLTESIEQMRRGEGVEVDVKALRSRPTRASRKIN
jgi:DNA-binding transcriptional MerR regulator